MSIQIYFTDNINLTIVLTLEMQNYPYMYAWIATQFKKSLLPKFSFVTILVNFWLLTLVQALEYVVTALTSLLTPIKFCNQKKYNKVISQCYEQS